MGQPKYFRCSDGDVILFPDLVHSVSCFQDGDVWLVELRASTPGGLAKDSWARKTQAEAIEVRDHLISILNLNIVN
jgi:hypothetical protein